MTELEQKLQQLRTRDGCAALANSAIKFARAVTPLLAQITVEPSVHYSWGTVTVTWKNGGVEFSLTVSEGDAFEPHRCSAHLQIADESKSTLRFLSHVPTPIGKRQLKYMIKMFNAASTLTNA